MGRNAVHSSLAGDEFLITWDLLVASSRVVRVRFQTILNTTLKPRDLTDFQWGSHMKGAELDHNL